MDRLKRANHKLQTERVSSVNNVNIVVNLLVAKVKLSLVQPQDQARQQNDKLRQDLEAITEKGQAVVALNSRLMAQVLYPPSQVDDSDG